MIAAASLKKNALLLVALLVSGCGVASSNRPEDMKTIRDFSGSSYRETVGVMALTNTTFFTSAQVVTPFMTTFLASVESATSDAMLVVPGQAEFPPFLWDSPRLANGVLDVFTLSGLAREEGLNAVVSPVLMDIRVRTRNTGFWFFRDLAYSLQIQTAASIFDSITGTRLDLVILTDEVDIDEDQADIIGNGQEVEVDDLVEVAEKMGEKLGKRMGDAISNSKWWASVISIENGACVIMAGSDVGIQAGDRFAVLDASGVLSGLDGQRYIVPGLKIGEIIISRVAHGQSFGVPESGAMPPVGSILIPVR